MPTYSNRFAIYIAGGRILSMLAGFIMPLALVRIMSQSDYGIFSQFFTLYSAVYVIIAMGIHTNLFYFCPSADEKDITKFESNTFALLALFGIISILVLFAPPVKNLVFGQSLLGKYDYLIILSIAFAVPMNIISPLNTTREDKLGALLIPGLVAFSRIGTVFLSITLFAGLQSVFVGMLFFQIVIFVFIIWYVFHDSMFNLDWRLMKQQLAYSLPFGFAVALQLFSNYYDKFVCIKYISPIEYAVYAVAFLSIPGINQIYDSLCQVNIVNMSKSYRNGCIEEIPQQYGTFVLKTLSFSLPIILSVSLYSEEIMSFLYTEKYLGAAPFFRVYTLTYIVSMLGAGTILRSIGKTKLSLASYSITCIVGLPITYYLVVNYGTNGAIWGAVINIVMPRIMQMLFEVYSLRISLKYFLPWLKIIVLISSAIILLIPMCVLKHFCELNILWCILVSLMYIIILYMFYVYLNIFIFERKVVFDMIKKIKKFRR